MGSETAEITYTDIIFNIGEHNVCLAQFGNWEVVAIIIGLLLWGDDLLRLKYKTD